MKRILLMLISVAFALGLSAHPWKSQHYVIIDTDCGLDDYRTICMLMASPDVRVLAITTSDGVIDAGNGYYKVRSLLRTLHHEGIPVGYHTDPGSRTSFCQPALQMEWGTAITDSAPPPTAIDVINDILKNHRERITYICLGSLSTVRLSAEQCPAFTGRIKEILWSSSPDYKTGNFNYDLDRYSASSVIAGKIPVCLVHCGSLKHYDDTLVSSVTGIRTVYAERLIKSLLIKETPYARALFDEAIALFIHYPRFFKADTIENTIRYSLQNSFTNAELCSMFHKILTGETINQNQVLAVFPIDTSFYFTDIQSSIVPAVEKYGREEWVAGVITSEMHRHLGVYSIIGVKMGLRAREFFGAGIDEMSIVSYAGLTPPFSCLNDGLQASTGATMGHGLIKVASDTLTLPMADFIYMNRKIRVSLKPEIKNKVESEIRELSKIYGLDSDIYWELVRSKAIKYWTAFDRHEIFTIEFL